MTLSRRNSFSFLFLSAQESRTDRREGCKQNSDGGLCRHLVIQKEHNSCSWFCVNSNFAGLGEDVQEGHIRALAKRRNKIRLKQAGEGGEEEEKNINVRARRVPTAGKKKKRGKRQKLQFKPLKKKKKEGPPAFPLHKCVTRRQIKSATVHKSPLYNAKKLYKTSTQ